VSCKCSAPSVVLSDFVVIWCVSEENEPPRTPSSAATLGLIVELLCFCVKYHSYRIKYYVLRNNVVEKVSTQLPFRVHLSNYGDHFCLL
jgi:hypothetical protein